MTVGRLIELLSAQNPKGAVCVSRSSACAEISEKDVVIMPWGVVFS